MVNRGNNERDQCGRCNGGWTWRWRWARTCGTFHGGMLRGNNERDQWLVDVAMVERCNGDGRGRGSGRGTFHGGTFHGGMFHGRTWWDEAW